MDTPPSEVVFNLVWALKEAIARVQIANEEGDPILSAWLPEARKAVADREAYLN